MQHKPRANREPGFSTRAIHLGYDPMTEKGALTPPIFMKPEEEAPAEEHVVEPGRPGGRYVDQQDDEVGDHVDGRVVIEQPQATDPPPSPLLDLGIVGRLADPGTWQDRRRLARLASRRPLSHGQHRVHH